MANKTNGKVQNKRYILKKSKNGRKREKHIGAALYGTEKSVLMREKREYARKYLNCEDMSMSAYISIKLLIS